MSILRSLQSKIQQLGVTELSKRTGISKMQIHRIVNGTSSPTLQTLEKIGSALGYELELRPTYKEELFRNDDKGLKQALAHYGAPLLVEGDKSPQRWPSLRQTVLRALERGREEPDINSVLPYFLNSNREDLDFAELARLTNEPRYLAYLLTVLFHITSERIYLEGLRCFSIPKGSQGKIPLIKQSLTKQQKKRLSQSKNKLAEMWGFMTLDSIDSIQNRFNKWSSANL